MTVSSLFRKPKFPIIYDIDGNLIAAKSISGFEKQLSAYNMCKGSRYPVIDITGEGWSFYPDLMVISPLTMKKKWFKKEVITIFNNRKNNTSNVTYSEKWISATNLACVALLSAFAHTGKLQGSHGLLLVVFHHSYSPFM